ncbi:selenium-binding protein SBP56-related protein [Natrinema sp. 1APR25-10V2]|uniref:selenium-binding protein SBP56-related protein n=1 Tax=Natrinema sp. 1APR25-10V2 TaxID=2951081 RepID=UPI002875ABEF|nr:selenium-binding protein SBP56-related protein [Natrinema sp. 1APR25-10V2]MDS0478513.1 selenium-binding family protein [Natrinema sp. 1APR25-10V2]
MSSHTEHADESHVHEHHASAVGYETPRAAIEESPRETVAYVPALYVGTETDAPDMLTVVDVDPDSSTYCEIIDRVEMPTRGDELHHFGWNACSSSCHVEGAERRYLVVPGNRSSRLHIIVAEDRQNPELVKVIEPEEVFEYDLSAPHTVHCIPDGMIMISMLGDADGDLPGGFLLLNEDFEIEGRWDTPGDIQMNYDFWYQPRRNVMVSSEWAAPSTYQSGFDLEDVEAGKYGQRLHVWNWEDRTVEQTIDLGEEGLVPLEVRFLHSSESEHAYVGAALSSNMFHLYREESAARSAANEASGGEPRTGGEWHADNVIDVEPREHEDWDMPVPGLITDLVVSMDDRYLFFANWLHGEVRMYDISDPSHPRLVDTLSVGGLFGDVSEVQGRPIHAGPQMLQLSLDGERLYFTTSLYSTWDDQFFPEEGKRGSVMLEADVDPRRGTMTLDEAFLVDFGTLPAGPARAHEIRWPDGDCTSDVWM